ncbi:hypothetical protein BJX96DRAFT_186182 [Aspergillus floccosus]
MEHIHLQIEDPNPGSLDEEIARLVESAIQATPIDSADDTASALDSLYIQYMTHWPEREPEGFLLHFWELLYIFASQIPHDDPAQDKLVDVLKELTRLPSRTIVVWSEECQLWSDMPLFAAEFPANWEVFGSELPIEVRKQKVLNMHAYAARILRQRLAALEHQAIWALSEAVEGAIVPVRGRPDIVSQHPTAVVDLPYKTALAAMWVIHAGHVLFGRDEVIERTAGGPLWVLPKKEAHGLRIKYRGTQGLCRERWKLWKNQFCAIRDCEEVEADTRNVARRAVLAMERAEEER